MGIDIAHHAIHILSLHTPFTRRVESKGQNIFLLKVVMLHINAHSQPPDVVKWLNIFILNVVMLHNKLKAVELKALCKHIFCPYTHPQPVGWIQR